MNKFFRLVSMFAIAGATFAYTSCTDYSEDINKANDRIDSVVSDVEALKPIKDQVESLKTTVAGLETAQTKAEATISELQTALKTLQDKHDADFGKLNTEVTSITATIEALQNSVKALQDKAAEVEKVLPTLATKTDLEEVSKKVAEQIAGINTTIGTLQGNLATAQSAITALQQRMDTVEGDVNELKTAVEKAQKAADAAQTAADEAQEDATTALGEIKSLKEALKSYATIAALDAAVEQLEKIDSTLQADKFNTKDFTATFAKELEDVIGVYAKKGALEAKIAALDGKDEELAGEISKVAEDLVKAEEALDGKISALDTKVETYKKEVDGRINSVLGIIAGRLTSIAFVPAYYYDGVPAILFETIAYNPLTADENEVAVTYENKGDQNSLYANKFKNFTSALATAKYRLNPRTVGEDCADFSFVGDKADYVFTRANAPAAPVSIEGTPEYDAKTGYVIFSVKKNEKLNVTDNSDKNLDIVALKAVLKKGLTEAEAAADNKPEVYSEYTHVNEIVYDASEVAISDKAKLAKKAKDHEYAKTFKAATEQNYVYSMPYDKPFDLKKLVATCITTNIYTDGLEKVQDHANLDLAKYDLEYSFSVAKSDYFVKSLETETNQQTVIECIDAENGIYKVKAAQGVEYNKEAIGRTPIVRVDLKHGDNIVTRAFIKLLITVDKTYAPINVTDNISNVVYQCPETEVKLAYTEEKLREDLYRVLNIDHVSFWNTYAFDRAYVNKDGKKVATITAPELLEGLDENGKATKTVVWNFTHGEVGKIGNGAKVEGYLVVKNQLDAYSEYPTEITFKFTVNFSLPTPEVTAEIKDIFWKDDILQANVNRPESITDVAENCWFCTPIAEQPWKVLSVKGLPCGESTYFRIASVYKNGVKSAYKGTVDGVYLTDKDGTTELSIALDKTNASIKAALNSEKGLQAIVEWYAEGKSGDTYVLHTFTVNFIRPVNLNLPETLSVKDAVDGGDEITFGYEGLLTDWRGEVILPPTTMEVLKDGYYWNKVCSPADHAVLEPAYTKVIKEGYYEVEFQDVEVVIPAGAPYYEASIQLSVDEAYKTWYDNGKPWGKKPAKHNWKETEVVYGYGRTAGEAKEAARAKVNLLDVHYLDGLKECGRWAVELPVKEITSGSEFSFKVISKVTYHEAVTEEVEAKLIYSECNPQPGPSSDVYTVGQRIGCWEWQKYVYTDKETNPGQYWAFYGKFGDIVLDLERDSDGNYKNVKTDLVGGKLPSGASLVQTGYKLKYENVQSPIQYSYHISIPASIQYGWGTLTGELRITVKPADTINPENTIK